MKKLIVKIKVIVTPFSPAIPFSPEKWVKDGVETYSIPEAPEEYVYHPAIEAKDEVAEVKEWRIIAQTQGSDADLWVWLQGDMHKYPEGYQVEYIDISSQFNQDIINAEALKYLADTDWLIIREVDAEVPCPPDIKQLRAEARARIVR